ncbi:MAG: VIT1/CCC1 transporter family protein [Calditrichia bacterium]
MHQTALDKQTIELIRTFQKNEISEYHIYSALAKREGGGNGRVLQKIAEDEKKHYEQWSRYSGAAVKPNRWLITFYLLIARIFGITFAIKMMEKGEEKAEQHYKEVISKIPEARSIMQDEMDHEKLLVEMIDEEKIGYISSMVLGLNDALVELTGALAGFTLALQNSRIIGMAGLITGIAATLSMAASEYLSQKSEPDEKDPLRAAFYTGLAYIGAVVLLVIPFFLLQNYYLALALTLFIAVLIILLFSQFVSVVKDIGFAKFFWEMILISFGVAAISFFIGWIARLIFKVEL